MNRLASPAQLRASLIRWSLFLIPSIVLLGVLSGQLAGSGADNPWFAQLEMPDLYPPPATFGIVWAILYVLMGFSFALVCAAWGSRWRLTAVLAFIVQLALNLAWSPLFFAAHEIELAFYLILLVIAAAVFTTVLFARVRKRAAWLMVPYLAWICFAAGLNWEIWQLNPQADGAQVSNAAQRFEL